MNQPDESQSDFARRYIARGREEGRQEGRQEGLLAILLRQVTRRWPTQASTFADLMPTCSDADLRWLADQVLDRARRGSAVAHELQRRTANR